MYETWIVWGEPSTVAENGESSLCHYKFSTQAELEAFMEGVSTASLYNDYKQFDTEAEAEKYFDKIFNED